jgi:phospholipid/cholesterol/gamma-HCH transport system substrate-binding protein
METRAHYAAVGAFVLATVLLAFIAVLWLARGSLNTQFAYYDIYFGGPVSGLNNGAPVEYNGLRVGRVLSVQIDPSNVERIQVNVEIQANIAIKTDAEASVETNILSGVSFIQIVGGTQEAPLLQPKPGERYAVIRSHRSRLASVTARAPQLIEKLNDAVDHVNDLLDDKNRKAFAEIIENARVFSAGLAARSKNIEEAVDNVSNAAATFTTLLGNVNTSYVGPDGLGNKAGTALADIDKLAKNLNDTDRQLQGALQDVRPGLKNFSQGTLGDVASLIGETRRLIAEFTRLTTEIERDPSQVLFGDRRQGYRPR